MGSHIQREYCPSVPPRSCRYQEGQGHCGWATAFAQDGFFSQRSFYWPLSQNACPHPAAQSHGLKARVSTCILCSRNSIPVYFSVLLGHIHLASSSKRFIEHLTQVLVKLRRRKPWLQAALLLLTAARACGCGCLNPRPGQVSSLCMWPSVLQQGHRWRRTPSCKDPAP